MPQDIAVGTMGNSCIIQTSAVFVNLGTASLPTVVKEVDVVVAWNLRRG